MIIIFGDFKLKACECVRVNERTREWVKGRERKGAEYTSEVGPVSPSPCERLINWASRISRASGCV